ncbi:hypothetical protein LTR94_030739, partial [Friedmanniomyces endolithicus]
RARDHLCRLCAGQFEDRRHRGRRRRARRAPRHLQSLLVRRWRGQRLRQHVARLYAAVAQRHRQLAPRRAACRPRRRMDRLFAARIWQPVVRPVDHARPRDAGGGVDQPRQSGPEAGPLDQSGPVGGMVSRCGEHGIGRHLLQAYRSFHLHQRQPDQRRHPTGHDRGHPAAERQDRRSLWYRTERHQAVARTGPAVRRLRAGGQCH